MTANRAERLFIRVSDDERAKLQAAADARGLTLSAYIRMVALDAAKREMKK
jgi:uncharacterized protein (DUF1778 family)